MSTASMSFIKHKPDYNHIRTAKSLVYSRYAPKGTKKPMNIIGLTQGLYDQL